MSEAVGQERSSSRLTCTGRHFKLPSSPSHAAVAQLYAELSELNLNLPARVCVPLYGSCHQVLRVPTSEAVVLNSKSKVGKEGDESVSVEVGRRG